MSTNHVQSAGCETHHDQSSCSPVCKLRKDFSPDNRFGKPAFKTRSGQPIRALYASSSAVVWSQTQSSRLVDKRWSLLGAVQIETAVRPIGRERHEVAHVSARALYASSSAVVWSQTQSSRLVDKRWSLLGAVQLETAFRPIGHERYGVAHVSARALYASSSAVVWSQTQSSRLVDKRWSLLGAVQLETAVRPIGRERHEVAHVSARALYASSSAVVWSQTQSSRLVDKRWSLLGAVNLETAVRPIGHERHEVAHVSARALYALSSAVVWSQTQSSRLVDKRWSLLGAVQLETAVRPIGQEKHEVAHVSARALYASSSAVVWSQTQSSRLVDKRWSLLGAVNLKTAVRPIGRERHGMAHVSARALYASSSAVVWSQTQSSRLVDKRWSLLGAVQLETAVRPIGRERHEVAHVSARALYASSSAVVWSQTQSSRLVDKRWSLLGAVQLETAVRPIGRERHEVAHVSARALYASSSEVVWSQTQSSRLVDKRWSLLGAVQLETAFRPIGHERYGVAHVSARALYASSSAVVWWQTQSSRLVDKRWSLLGAVQLETAVRPIYRTRET
ncbi:hypothetical protein C0Q70_13547 [Pomacea canaliculata]|uniref:Uncharacterized protein n=1 Tax=Pomacea canaliculata TaxID=400727 RepID=A0A2T7NXL7_POMCA|nr:hypothetical protein C0Q70_13547 [Pomacea canaliculata]